MFTLEVHVEEGQLRRYGPGDTIRLQVGVQHRMRLEQVFAS